MKVALEAPPAHGNCERPLTIESRPRPVGLKPFFAPGAVALIGASAQSGSVGRAVGENLRGFGGKVFAVNPKHQAILGRPSYPGIGQVPEKVDLAVIVTPASTVPGIIAECVEVGVPAAVIVSAGFKECGAAGAELEHQIAAAAKGAIRILGPNCLGVMSPRTGLNATFAGAMAQPGHVAFLSQSGALCTAILDWSLRERVGFSAFVSVGSMLDVGWGDLIDYCGDDPHTHSIVIYMESIGDARSFLSAAREVALTKPIVVIKVGRTEAAAKAAASHTGALTGQDAVLDAAFARAGVLRVDTIEALFDMAEVLAKQPRPRGPRLTIVTNAGGPGALAADMLVSSGGQLAPLSEGTMAELNQLLPAPWSHGNPIDILGDADAGRFRAAVAVAARDTTSDGVLVVLTPQAMTDPTVTARELKTFARLEGGKPILASWMGGAAVDAGEQILNEAGIPTFKYPDRAARAFEYMWRYSSNLNALYETPVPPVTGEGRPAREKRADRLVAAARKAGRVLLTEHESKQLLSAYGIPTVETVLAESEDEAVAVAQRLGFPVVLKLNSRTITHKSAMGGVRLDLRGIGDVRQAWHAIRRSVQEKAGLHHFLGVTVQRMVRWDGFELIIGASIDPQFGPVLMFGAGGRTVEALKDCALGLPPLNTTLARRMMERSKIYPALMGRPGLPAVDLPALEGLLVAFSRLVTEQRWIAEMDLNPLLAGPHGMVALDARIVLHGPAVRPEQLPRLAIRPYPAEYMSSTVLADGTAIAIRPIRPDDEPLMVKFHQALSERSVSLRYFGLLSLEQRIRHQRLARLCAVDYDREIALVAIGRDPSAEPAAILGVGRLCRVHGQPEAEFALVVGDAWQGRGLGTRLMQQLIQVARAEGLLRLKGFIMAENIGMKRLCGRLGFALGPSAGGECRAEMAL